MLICELLLEMSLAAWVTSEISLEISVITSYSIHYTKLYDVSISNDPVMNMPKKALGKLATMISMALRKTCPYNTRRSVSPLALAVSTYCWLIWSRKEFLVSWVRAANPPMTIAVTGRGDMPEVIRYLAEKAELIPVIRCQAP